MTVNYRLGSAWNETDDPFGLPADNRDPDADWGPARSDVRHRLSGYLSTRIWKGLNLDTRFAASSGQPYTIATGRDGNGDTVLNDRPAGVGRNSARGAWQANLNERLTWRLGVGPPAAAVPIMNRIGDTMSVFTSGSAMAKRYTLVLYADAQNVLNRVNDVGYSGVMTSPFVGRPTAALTGRQIRLGAQFVF